MGEYSVDIVLSRGLKRKVLFKVWAVLDEYQLKRFLYRLSQRSEREVISSTWLVPKKRVKIKGKYKIVGERRESVELIIHRLDVFKWRSLSGFSHFTWTRKYGRYGVLEGVLSEFALTYLIQVVGEKRIKILERHVVDVEKLLKYKL